MNDIMMTVIIRSDKDDNGFEYVSTTNKAVCDLWTVVSRPAVLGDMLFHINWKEICSTPSDVYIVKNILQIFPSLQGFLLHYDLFCAIQSIHLKHLVVIMYTGLHHRLADFDFKCLWCIPKNDQVVLEIVLKHFPLLREYL